jgi:hypothetical protein
MGAARAAGAAAQGFRRARRDGAFRGRKVVPLVVMVLLPFIVALLGVMVWRVYP